MKTTAIFWLTLALAALAGCEESGSKKEIPVTDGSVDGDTDADGDGDTDGDTDTDIDSDELSTRSTSDDSCTYVPSSARGLSPLALIDVFSQ